MPQTSEDVLRDLSARAAVIFTGQVTEIRRRAGVATSGIVEVDFAVDDAVRGVATSTYTMREWAGLWAAGETPFCVGQRYLMLLRAPGISGLSSPVAGTDGAIPILGAPTPDSTAQSNSAAGYHAGQAESSISDNTDNRSMDLRWIAARAVRPVANRRGSLPLSRLSVPETGSGEDSASFNPGVGTVAASPAPMQQTAPYVALLRLLMAWERAPHGGR